jgi:hypothetical protein
MKKGLIVFCISGFLLLPWYLALAADNETDAVLTSAEGLFKAMQEKDYAGIWTGLSAVSRDTIVGDTCKTLGSGTAGYPEKSVREDFQRGDVVARAYWDAYLKNFDPVLILQDSKWEMGSIKGDKARIIITYKKAQKPATLLMFKEEGRWRVGLTESFWSRK